MRLLRLSLALLMALGASACAADIDDDDQIDDDADDAGVDDDDDDDAADTTPPEISDLSIEAQIHTATVSFRTDEQAVTRLFYGRESCDENSTEAAGPAVEHVFELTGLHSFSFYSLCIQAVDASGNRTSPPPYPFATDEYRAAFISWQEIRHWSEEVWAEWLDMMIEEGIQRVELGVPSLADMGTFDFNAYFGSSPFVGQLVRVSELAHEKGMSVSIVAAQFSAPDDPGYDDYFAKDINSGRLAWLCPANPWVHDLMRQLMSRWVDEIAPDAVALDLVRYHDTYCLCDYHIQHSLGEPGTPEWDGWSSDELIKFVEGTKEMLAGSGVTLEAYVWDRNQRFHEWVWGSERFFFRGQDWVAWAQRDAVDVIKNMDYYDFIPWLKIMLDYQEARLRPGPTLWAPAFWFSLSETGVDTEEELRAVLGTMRERDVSGYSIFDWQKIVSRPAQFGWAHEALIELNARPR